MSYVLQILGRADGAHSESAGLFVKAYDPDYIAPGRPVYPNGLVTTTSSTATALQFETPSAALDFYVQRSRAMPDRPDGQPNRPLTAYSVSVQRA